MTSGYFLLGRQLIHDPQLTLRPRGVDNAHILQCLHPVFMRLNIAVKNLVGFAVGVEVQHLPQSRGIWTTSWSTACPTTAARISKQHLQWSQQFSPQYSVDSRIINNLPAIPVIIVISLVNYQVSKTVTRSSVVRRWRLMEISFGDSNIYGN